jgi:hypothetical protein
MAKLTPPEEKLLAICKENLDSIIREWSDDIEADPEVVLDEVTRFRMKQRLMIESAVGQMWAKVFNRHGTILHAVEDIMPVWREAYVYAVDAYFRIYLGYQPRKRGRPRLPSKTLRELYDADQGGKTVGEIMIARGMDPNDRRAHERMRGQIRAARVLFASGNNSVE